MSDNLLAGLEGFTEGFSKTVVPLLNKKAEMGMEEQLLTKKKDAEYNQFVKEQTFESELTKKEKMLEDALLRSRYLDELNQRVSAEGDQKMKDSKSKTVSGMFGSDLTKRPPEFRSHLYDPMTPEQVIGVIGLSIRENKAEEGKNKLSAAERKDLKLIESSRNAIFGPNGLKAVYEKARGGSGVTIGAGKQLLSHLSFGLIDPSAKAYDDLKGEYLQTTQRQMTGSARNTKLVFEKAMTLFPSLHESGELADMKWNQLDDLLGGREDSLAGSVSDIMKKSDSGLSVSMPTTSGSTQFNSVPQVGQSFNGKPILNVKRIK